MAWYELFFLGLTLQDPTELLGLAMFGLLIIFLGSGYPVTFSIAGAAMVFALIGISWMYSRSICSMHCPIACLGR